MIRAVLFDLDGVLLDSFEAWLALTQEGAKKFGAPPITRDAFRAVFGQDTKADVDAFYRGRTVEEVDRFFAEGFLAYVDRVVLLPGASEVLDALGARSIARVVVTNTTAPLARALLEHFDLRSRLEGVVAGGDAPHNKPHPDPVHLALRQAQVDASEALFVGDSAYDRDAASAAGVRFVGLGIDGDVRIETLEGILRLV